MKHVISLLVCLTLSVGVAQKEYVVHTVPYNAASSWNVEVKLSPGFLTEINFPSPIKVPGSGNFDFYELIGESGDVSIWLRPKSAFAATDLWVPMENGDTAIFYITYDDTEKVSRKYVPADTVTSRTLAPYQTEDTLTSDIPTWLHFNYDAAVQGDDLTVAYSLENNGLNPIINDSPRLRILADGEPLDRTLSAEGRKNRLESGESEAGTITVRDLPMDTKEVMLEWVLVAQDTGELYRLYEPLTPR